MARRQQDQENHLRGKLGRTFGQTSRPGHARLKGNKFTCCLRNFIRYISLLLSVYADIKRQLSEQLSCLDIRTESKNALLSEMQDFLKRRGDAEFEYAKSLERLCERFERSIKQRGIK